MAKYNNPFMLGADPEFVLLKPPNLVNANNHWDGFETGNLFGFDHGGYVVEPHPAPNVSARKVCDNIRKSLDYLFYLFPNLTFRAGAYLRTPERAVTLGGHVHFDLRQLEPAQVKALDAFTQCLEHLDILPTNESSDRRNGTGYGFYGDIRAEHGHVEYRSMCSWLYDPKVAMLAMTGAKLAVLNPTETKVFQSRNTLLKWLENYKGDSDVDWILEKGYFDAGGLKPDPDANLPTVWRCSLDRGKAIAETIASKKKISKLAGAHVAAARAAVRVGGVRPGAARLIYA